MDFEDFGNDGNDAGDDYGATFEDDLDFGDASQTQALVPADGKLQAYTASNQNATATALDNLDFELPPVQVRNIIAGFNTGCDLDLRLVTIAARNVEYNPRKQNAAVVRLQNPRATCMLFPNGRVSITGTRAPQDAKKVAKIVARLCQKAGHPEVRFIGFRIESLVCSAACGFPVRLENLAKDHARYATYEPEIFCGVIYRYQITANVKASILIFVSGKIVITGCKKPSDANEVFKNLYAVLYQYRA